MDKLKKVLSGPNTEDQGGQAQEGVGGGGGGWGGGTFLKLGCQNRKLPCVSCDRNSLLTPGHASALAAEEGLDLCRFTPLVTPHPLGACLTGPMNSCRERSGPWV